MLNKENNKKGKQWNEYFRQKLKKGLSWYDIRTELIIKGGYASRSIELLIYKYTVEAEKAIRKRVIATFLACILLLAIILPLSLIKPEIIGKVTWGFGDTYYVDSVAGNDANDGLSPDTPLKTITKVNTLHLHPGDSVLFKRESVWRCASEGYLDIKSGDASGLLLYSSYGSGDKPLLMGSIEANQASNWSNGGSGNIWNTTFTIPKSKDVGNIYFDNGALSGYKKSTYAALTKQGYFYHDPNGIISLYSTSNPATYYPDIEMAIGQQIVDLQAQNYVIIENLDIEYSGHEGIVGSFASHITIRNNTVKYMGGSYQTGTLRYANGIDMQCAGHDIKIHDNYVSQVYDAAIVPFESYNSCKGGHQNNSDIEVYNNIVTYSGNSYQSFSSNISSTVANINVHHNTFVYSGGGWMNGQRPDHGIMMLLGTYHPTDVTNYNFTDNIFYNISNNGEYINLGWDTPGAWRSTNYPNFNHNLYYAAGTAQIIYWNDTGYTSFSAFQENESQEANGLLADPLFVDAANGDFTPQSDSPACTMSSTGSYVGALPCESGSSPICGDDSCNGDENCSTCEADCGSCPPVNNPPTQLTPILNASDNPYNTTDATLTCYNQSTSDADGDPVNNSYGWFRNSTLVSGLTTNSVNAGNTTEGETWKCKITPYDGTDNGTAKNSSALTINQLPNTLLVKINSSSGTNYSNENLTCYANATGFATNITLYYRVLNGSMLYASGSKSVIKNTLSSITTINSSALSGGQVWKCSVKASYNGVINESEWNNASLTVITAPYCDDSSCNDNENCSTCAADCGSCPVLPYCGDSSCNGAENCSTCNADCGTCPIIPSCGDGSCNGNENCSSCNIDCGNCPVVPICGDSVCNGAENCSTCSQDCGSCPVIEYCGDGICNNNENCSSCSADCGNCPIVPYCGDGACDNNENCSTCIADCGACPVIPFCGDETCNGNENCSTCSNDCGNCTITPVCGDNSCNGAENCSTCSADCGNCTIAPYCGDGTCNNNESCSTCAADCGTCPEIQTPSRGGSGGSSRSTTNKNITNISSGRQGETKISTKEGTTKVKQETGEEETEGQVVEEPNQEIPGNIDIGSQNDIASAPKGILIILAILTLIGLASVAKEAYPDLKKALKSTGSSETGSKAKDLSITYQEENNIEDLAKLHHYVKEAAKQGYTREKVRSELSGVGWEREIIEPLLLMHEPEFLPPLLPEPPVIQSLDAQKQPKEAYMLNPVKKWLEFERIDYKEESEHEDKGGLR